MTDAMVLYAVRAALERGEARVEELVANVKNLQKHAERQHKEAIRLLNDCGPLRLFLSANGERCSELPPALQELAESEGGGS